MSTTVYLPPTEGLSGIGNALGAAASSYMDMQQQKADMQKIQDMQKLIINPDVTKEQAFSMISQLPLRTPEQLHQMIQFVQDTKSMADTTPHEVKTTDAQGNVTTKFVPAKDLPASGNVAPHLSHYYEYDPSGNGMHKDLGMGPTNAPPAGTDVVTAEQIKQRQDAISAAQSAASAKNQELADRIATNKQFRDSVTAILPATVKKVAADGSFSVDFTGNPKLAEAYKNTLTNQDELLKKNKGNFNKAAYEGLSSGGAYDKPAPEAQPAPAAPSGGGITDSLKALFLPSKKSDASGKTATPEAKGSAPSAFVTGKVYVDAKGNKATYKGKKNGKDVWE